MRSTMHCVRSAPRRFLPCRSRPSACSGAWGNCSAAPASFRGAAAARNDGEVVPGAQIEETLEILSAPKETMDMARGKSAGRKSAGGKRATGYKLATYRTGEDQRAGVLIGDDVFDAEKLTGKVAYATVAGILADWKAADGAL